jgi:hypothetical protein
LRAVAATPLPAAAGGRPTTLLYAQLWACSRAAATDAVRMWPRRVALRGRIAPGEDTYDACTSNVLQREDTKGMKSAVPLPRAVATSAGRNTGSDIP